MVKKYMLEKKRNFRHILIKKQFRLPKFLQTAIKLNPTKSKFGESLGTSRRKSLRQSFSELNFSQTFSKRFPYSGSYSVFAAHQIIFQTTFAAENAWIRNK